MSAVEVEAVVAGHQDAPPPVEVSPCVDVSPSPPVALEESPGPGVPSSPARLLVAGSVAVSADPLPSHWPQPVRTAAASAPVRTRRRGSRCSACASW